MVNPSGGGRGGGSSSGDAGSSGIQFRMTVKVDIEGQIPASSSASDAQSVCAAAASSSTQDLLLKLQPLLPHICIAKSSASAVTEDRPRLPAALDNPDAAAAAAENAVDDSGLELSLGLSLFRTKSGAAAAENLENACAWQDLSGGGGGQEQVQQDQVLQRQVSNAAAATADWRTSEEQRLKREAQCQKRQEARKKRRILIDEQKLQRKSAAKSSSLLPVAGAARKSRSASEMNTVTNTANEHKSENAGEKTMRSSSSSRRCRRKLSIKSEPEDQSQLSVSSAAATAAAGGGIIRPDCSSGSSEWVQKFLEMQKVVKCSSDSIDSRSEEQPGDESAKNRLINFGPPPPLPPPLPPGDSITSSVSSSMSSFPSSNTIPNSFAMPAPISPSRRQDISYALGTKVQDFSRDIDTKGREFSQGSQQAQDRVQAPAPQGQECLQASQVMQAPQVQDPLQQASRTQDQCTPLQESNRSDSRAVLMRSTSVGAGFWQQKHSIQIPSPVRYRSSSSNSSLLRTLSEGAAMRSILMNKDGERHFCWTKTRKQEQDQQQQQSKPGSAFKSPKKEADGASNVASGSGETSGGTVQLPWVTTTGPNGKTISGVLLAYKKGDVRIVCACHGQHFTPKEFVIHAGGNEVSNPEKYIVVTPARRLSFNSPR